MQNDWIPDSVPNLGLAFKLPLALEQYLFVLEGR